MADEPKLPTLLVPGSLRVGDEPVGGLPIKHIVAWIRDRLPDSRAEIVARGAATNADRVLVVKAETGSGKSTVLPVWVLRLFRGASAGPSRSAATVICTQPRVLTAIALARDVDRLHSPWNADIVLGETVGFQTGPLSERPPAGLVYATAGVLAAVLRRAADDELMAAYRVIIVDEAHERSLDGDQLLAQLRNFYERNAGNERLPFLLLASATIDPRRYAAYFGVGPANVVEVTGRAYPIVPFWPATGYNDYLLAAAETAYRIHTTNRDDKRNSGDESDAEAALGRRDILIFVPGAGEALAVAGHLARLNTSEAPMLVLNINRETIVEQAPDYGLVFAPPDALPLVNGRRPGRRVIVSTVVAETGLTVDTLRYVIDCGWSRAREVYAPWGLEGLTTRPAAQSRIHQRRGRVGRLFPGEFHPLYTQNVFDALEPQQLPEIVLSGPAAIFLAMVREQQRQKLRMGLRPEFSYDDIAMLDRPPAAAFLAASVAATALGFVSAAAALPDRWPPDFGPGADAGSASNAGHASHGWGLTRLGWVASGAFSRTPMEGARMLFAGLTWGAAASDLTTAAAMLGWTLPSLFASSERRGDTPGARAMRDLLPSYLTRAAAVSEEGPALFGGGIEGTLPASDLEAAYFRSRLLVACDFATAALLYDAYVDRLDRARGDVAAVNAALASLGLAPAQFEELTRRRDLIAGEMVMAGLDPLRADDQRLAAARDRPTFEARLARLKRCLHDGLRHRLLTREDKRNSDGAAYRSPQGTAVPAPPLFSDAAMDRLRALRIVDARFAADGRFDVRPRWILTDSVWLVPTATAREPRSQVMYTLSAGMISVLDGVVEP